MAQSQPPQTWQRGFAEPAATATAAWADRANYETEDGERASAAVPAEGEKPTSDVPNDLGRGSLRSWPELYNGTEARETTPSWWRESAEVDVLICGGECDTSSCRCVWGCVANDAGIAGPFGLEVALSLARQGVSFRIVGKQAVYPVLARVASDRIGS